MKTKSPQSAQPKLAILNAVLEPASADGWRKLLPAGHFSARDGRPFDVPGGKWFLNAEIAASLIAATAAVGQPILIDYDHQSLHKATTGVAATAAGWITDPAAHIQWRDDGLYIFPTWTAPAQAAIDAKEWCFLSAVFNYNDAGHPTLLRMAAVTNDPGLTGFAPLVALAAASLIDMPQAPQTQEPTMNELLRLILIALGVIADDDATEYSDEQVKELVAKASESIATLKTASQAAAKTAEITTSESTPEAIATAVTDVVADSASAIAEAEEIIAEAALHSIDLSVAVPRKVYQKALNRIAALSTDNSNLSAEQLINKARAQGRITAFEVPDLLATAKTQGVAALNAIINTRSPIAALMARQTASLPAPSKAADKTAALTAEDLAVMKAAGIDEATFLKSKKEVFN